MYVPLVAQLIVVLSMLVDERYAMTEMGKVMNIVYSLGELTLPTYIEGAGRLRFLFDAIELVQRFNLLAS